jgi:hypothetical protein
MTEHLPAVVDEANPPPALVYESEKRAIAVCEDLDECQLRNAAYSAFVLFWRKREGRASQRAVIAQRCYLLSVRRAGELLQAIPPSPGVRTDIEPTQVDLSRLTRYGAAADAGLSRHQRDTALRLARVPAELFEREVEQSPPPTIATVVGKFQFEERGAPRPAGAEPPLVDIATHVVVGMLSKPGAIEGLARDLDTGGRDPRDINAVPTLLAMLGRIAADAALVDLDRVARGISAGLLPRVAQGVATAREFLDRVVDKLGLE